MFRPYMWAFFRFRSNRSRAAIQDVWGVEVGWGGGGKISFVSIVGTLGIGGYYKWIIISFLCTRVQVGFYSYARFK